MCCLEEEWDTEIIEKPDSIKGVLQVLEPNAGKLARSVLRGGSHGNVAFLPEHPIQEETSYGGQKLHTKSATYSSFYKLTETDELGITTYFSYDAAGRLITEQKDNLRTTYSYDPLGRLTHTEKPSTTYIQEYDYLGQLTDKRTEDQEGNTTFQEQYLYDAAGNKTHTITCDGVSVTSFNPHNLPIQSTDPCGHTTTYTYRYTPQFSKTSQDPDGIAKIETHDCCNRLKAIQVLNAQGKTIQHREFYYDLAGNKIQDLEHIYHGTNFTQTIETTFEHGPRGRIEKIVEANLKETRYLYDAQGRLSTIIKPDLTQIHHTYDPLGKLKTLVSTNLDYTYTYDKKGRVIKVNETERSYDAFNRRVSKQTPRKTIRYIWQGKNEIGSSDGDLRILGDGLGAEIGAATLIKLGNYTYIPLHDQRGAVVTLVDLKGKSCETIRYTAYGQELTSSTLSPWRFCSKRQDPETGYLYFGRRYYSPTLGRWISPDPKGFADGPNLYAYAHNSPLFEIDLYGEWGHWINTSRQWGGKFGRAAADFAFPCGSALYNLPANAPVWKRGALAFGAVGEAALLFAPPAKLGVSLAEKTVFQLGRSALTRNTERQMVRSAGKTASVASERRIVQSSAGHARETVVSKEGIVNASQKTYGAIHVTPHGCNSLRTKIPYS